MVRSLEERIKDMEKSLDSLISKAMKEGLKRGREEGLSEGKVSEELHALETYLSSLSFQQKKKEAIKEFTASSEFSHLVDDHLDAYKSSAKFEDLQLFLIKAAVNQILDRFKKKHLELDLSFLDESTEESEVVGDAEQTGKGESRLSNGEGWASRAE
ncbi:hypothetical protein L484_009980 [Morus notabilis]|uniref:Uncharacterized protein n=1 Tax=Morus notabilis TaxID=981085 RepID=W9S551_9ROSA|nr:hypothetical protein L484_009980 [Morus notabilis]